MSEAEAVARSGADASGGGGSEREVAGALRLEGRPGWVREEPASAMRAAEWRLPGPEGAEDARLVVYRFDGTAGSAEENVARWRSQFVEPVAAFAQRRREIGSLVVHEVRISGTYVAETRPGSGERVHEPGFRVLAAVVESPSGPWYPKLVGPEETVRLHEERWDEFLRSLAP